MMRQRNMIDYDALTPTGTKIGRWVMMLGRLGQRRIRGRIFSHHFDRMMEVLRRQTDWTCQK